MSEFDPEYLESILEHIDKYIVNGIYMYYDAIDNTTNDDMIAILSSIRSSIRLGANRYTFSLSIDKHGIEYSII